MTRNKKQTFEFSVPLRKSALPIIRSALTGALTTLGIDDDLSKAAASELASRCSFIMQTEKDTIEGNFQCRSEKLDTFGKILIKADCGMDMNTMAKLIAQSDIWNKFLKSSEFNKESGHVEIKIFTENR